MKNMEPCPQPQSLFLGFDDRIFLKEKLREERKKEYNLFLQEQGQLRSLKGGTPPATYILGQAQALEATPISSPAFPLPILNTYTNTHPPRREHLASRRDAATLTEAVDNQKRRRTWSPRHQGRRRHFQVYRPKELYRSEDELNTDEEEKLEFRSRRWQARHTPEPEHKEEIRKRRANRTHQDPKEADAAGVLDQSNNNNNNSFLQMPDRMRTAVRAGPTPSKDKAMFATGLMIGATEDQMASRMKKEQYKEELLKQIAEEQKNKMREKELELRVAATGAKDHEKEPDQLNMFGPVKWHHDSRTRNVPFKQPIGVEAVGKHPNPSSVAGKPIEDTGQTAPLEESQVAFPSWITGNNTAYSQLTGKTVPESGAAQDASLDYLNEDYRRDLSNLLGELVITRAPGAPIPLAVTHKTPHDAASYFHRTRNLLDPCQPHAAPGEVQQPGTFNNLRQIPASVRPGRPTDVTDRHRPSPLAVGQFAEPTDKSRQRREIAMRHQEALEQQIKEREERKRKEKEEKERYDAKLEKEMMGYNPWARSGGGAPIKDRKGNLVCDLNHMHRTNEEIHMNPLSKADRQTQDSVTRSENSLAAEARVSLSPRISDGVHSPDRSVKAVANIMGPFMGVNDVPSPQQPHMQNSYKEALKQQIEDERRRKAEEKERVTVEEARFEKKLAEQRARLQQEHEEEQRRRQEKIRHRLDNQSGKSEDKPHHQEGGKRVEEEEKIQRKVPESGGDREETQAQMKDERGQSPPVPAMQKKMMNVVASIPSSVVSLLSSSAQLSASPPHSGAEPAGTHQLQAPDGHQPVMEQLAAMRKYLRKQQRQLADEMGLRDGQEPHHTASIRPRGRPQVDAFESAINKQAVQMSDRSNSSHAARVNMQNIWEFNRLKHRDTASREEVRHMFPEPPNDAQSLDIQQQALLREQKRKIRLMKREEEPDFLDQQLSRHQPRKKPGCNTHRGSMMPSETAFFDSHSSDPPGDMVHQPTRPQPSAEHQDQRDMQLVRSLQSATSLNLESGDSRDVKRRDSFTGDPECRSGSSGDEVDVCPRRSSLERPVSVETVATEAWLRPGTSEAVKRSVGRRLQPRLTQQAI